MKFKRFASIDEKELEMGIEIEREHRDLLDLFKEKLAEKGVEMPLSDEEFFSMVAEAHLRELPDYYTRLKKMESGPST